MAKVKDGDTVKVHYTGKLKDGSIFDSSVDREPLAFTMGAGMMIPGFEKGVMGMALNEEKTIKIEPADAYGEFREDMIVEIPKRQLPPDMEVKVGMELVSQGENGQQFPVTVKEVKSESIVIDANHKLAGQELTFEISLVEIS